MEKRRSSISRFRKDWREWATSFSLSIRSGKGSAPSISSWWAEIRSTSFPWAFASICKPDNISLFIGPTYHGYSRENREAMYRWFNQVTGVSDAKTEPALTIEKDETLHCAPHGQVALLDSRTVFSVTREKSKAWAKQRQPLRRDTLRKAVAETLKLKPHNGVPDYRILRAVSGRRYPEKYFTTYAVTTEPGIQTIVYRLGNERLYSRPPKGRKRAVFYVSHHSSDAELRDEPLVRELIDNEKDTVFFACDVRGVGESRPNTTNPDSYLTLSCLLPDGLRRFDLPDCYAALKPKNLRRIEPWNATPEQEDKP